MLTELPDGPPARATRHHLRAELLVTVEGGQVEDAVLRRRLLDGQVGLRQGSGCQGQVAPVLMRGQEHARECPPAVIHFLDATNDERVPHEERSPLDLRPMHGDGLPRRSYHPLALAHGEPALIGVSYSLAWMAGSLMILGDRHTMKI